MSTPRAELEKQLGYQKDPKPAVQEAKQLMKEAGYGQRHQEPRLPRARHHHLQALGGGHPGHAEGAPQHRDATCAWCRSPQWFDEAEAGNFDLAISAIVSTLMDPSDYLHAPGTARTARRTTRGWTNPASTTSPARSSASSTTTSARPWSARPRTSSRATRRCIPVAYEQIYDAWYNKVHGQNPSTYFGIYDVVRWDTVSIAE